MTNILHIIPNLRKGGAERLVIDIVRELSKKSNINIRIILLENKIEYDIAEIKQYIHIVPASIQLTLIKTNTYNVRELQQFINEYQPDIIHTHLFETEIVSRTCLYPKAKWFSHCHDNMVQFKNFDFNTLMNKEQLTNQYEKKYLFNCYKKNGGTTFIAISNDTKKYFEQTAKPYKTSLLHNAINHQRFYRPLKKKRIGTLKLINTGSLQDKKNHAFLVTVANILKQKSISFELIFLGDGKNREKLKKNISEYNLHNNIYLQGNVENVEFFLWESHIYLHAATYEPLGLALLEAMAAGLPVITLDGKGNRDIIKQGKNGYIIFEHDAIQFSDTIIALWNDENKYQEMSTYAKEYAKKFDIKDYCNNLLKLYSSAYRSPNI